MSIQTAERIQAVGAGDEERAVAAIAAAFSRDPIVRWVFPDDMQYWTYFPRFVPMFGGAAFAAGTAHAAADFAGAALWLPPGTGPDGDAMGALLETAVPSAARDEVYAFSAKQAETHPHEPHWYLPLIGVEPAAQGRGLGSALLRHALEGVDRDGLPAYLEATSARSRALYERHGFEVLGEVQHGSSPTMSAARQPQDARAQST